MLNKMTLLKDFSQIIYNFGCPAVSGYAVYIARKEYLKKVDQTKGEKRRALEDDLRRRADLVNYFKDKVKYEDMHKHFMSCGQYVRENLDDNYRMNESERCFDIVMIKYLNSNEGGYFRGVVESYIEYISEVLKSSERIDGKTIEYEGSLKGYVYEAVRTYCLHNSSINSSKITPQDAVAVYGNMDDFKNEYTSLVEGLYRTGVSDISHN